METTSASASANGLGANNDMQSRSALHARAENTAGHVMIVDDDPDMRLLISNYLEREGFCTQVVADGSALRDAISAGAAPDVVLVDLGLPGEDGLSLVRYLRSESTAGILIVSGKSEILDRVVGLEVGADDYLPKPFDLRELLARVRSLIRRTAPGVPEMPASAVASERVRSFAGWRLDLMQRRLTAPDQTEVRLSTGEFELLLSFLDSPNRVLSRDDLMQRLHGRTAGPFDRSIDVQVGRLRRKLADDPAQPVLIKSVRGVGYFFAAKVSSQ